MNPFKNIRIFELSTILSLFHSNLKCLVQLCVYYMFFVNFILSPWDPMFFVLRFTGIEWVLIM
jgi:hypothetical protein